MRKALFGLICLPILCVLGTNANAQSSISVPGTSKFVLQVDLQSLRNSKIGGSLIDVAKKAAMDEVGKNLDSKNISLDKVREVVGFDPFEEIQGLVVCASDYEKPEKSLLGMVRLKKTTGNIEGLLLSLPGYEKSDHGKYEIHSASPSDKDKVFGAIHKNPAGNHTIILGADKKAVTNLLDSLDASTTENKALKSIALESDRKMIVSMQVLELPTTELGKGPQANIAALLSSMAVSIFEEDDELEVRCALQASTEKQADKILQSLQGLSAMVELFASMDQQDAETIEMLKFMKQVKVSHEGTSVKVKLRMPSQQIADMIKKEIADQ